MTKPKEFTFSWTCPTCQHHQDDTINFEQGPYLDAKQLSQQDADAWDEAIYQAELDHLGPALVAYANARNYTSSDLLSDTDLTARLQKEMEASQ